MAGHGVRARIPVQAGHELKSQVFGFRGIGGVEFFCRDFVAAGRNHGEKEDCDRETRHGGFPSCGNWTSDREAGA